MRFNRTKNQTFSQSHSYKLKTQFSSVPSVHDRDLLIQHLQEKNKKMKTQLDKIQQFLSHKTSPKLKQDRSFQLYFHKRSHNAEKKELQCAYKKIYLLESEIKAKQALGKQMNASKKLDGIYIRMGEQEKMSERLKKQIADLNKDIKRKNKRLENVLHEDRSQKVKELINQMQYLKQKIKETEQSKIKHEKSMRKQKKFIRNVETQITSEGVSKDLIYEIRNKIGGKLSTQKTQESRTASKDNFRYKTQVMKPIKEDHFQVIEEQIRTRKKFQKMQSEIILLKKVIIDQEKSISTEQAAYKKALNASKELESKINEVQNNIHNCETQIEKVRSSITKNDLKPKKYFLNLDKSAKSLHKKGRRISQKRKKKLAKIQHKTFNKIQQYSMLVNPNLKYDEAGLSTPKGVKFTDRKVLGHSTLKTYMTGFQVYVNKNYSIICGIKITYNHDIEGQLHIIDDELIYEECMQKFKCVSEQNIKSISGSFNMNNQLESLTVLTTNSRYCRFGRPQKTSNNFVFEIVEDQYPICLFGSMVTQEKDRQIKYIESIGVEIMKNDDFYGINQTGRSLAENQFTEEPEQL